MHKNNITKKLENIWFYHKYHLLVGIIALFIICVMITNIINRNTETRLHIVSIERPFSNDEIDDIKDEYSDYADIKYNSIGFGSNLKHYSTSDETTTLDNSVETTTVKEVEKPFSAMLLGDTSFNGLYTKNELDILFCPPAYADSYEGYCKNLLEVLPSDLKEQLKDKIYYSSKNNLPVGLDISGTTFAQKYDAYDISTVLCIPASTHRLNEAINFIRYVFESDK